MRGGEAMNRPLTYRTPRRGAVRTRDVVVIAVVMCLGVGALLTGLAILLRH
jgi:hypothetical protein